MFSKFTSILHQAVEALAPNLPLQQDFISHWKAVTHYFIDNKDHRVSVEQTVIPGHLEAMLSTLFSEEENASEQDTTGPCMEYMLQHRILETLYTLARTDCPPGMKQQVLIFFTKLLSRIQQPLLPHVNCHRAVHRLVRVCGEVKAAPSEAEEIQFLCIVCAKIRTDPYLVNFFIETPEKQKCEAEEAAAAENIGYKPNFALVDSLLNLMHSPDARVGVKACEGLMLCASLPEPRCAEGIIQLTSFCDELTGFLSSLYQQLPKAMDPADIDSVEAKWGLDIMCSLEDTLNFRGKRALISFLSWLDYCDQLIEISHPHVATSLASAIREKFLVPVLMPAIMQTSEAGAVTATAHLSRCVRLVSSNLLLKEFVYFILGEDETPEVVGDCSHKLRHRLIERCDHLSEELSLTSLKLFETLLHKPDPHIVHSLVLRNLIGRTYLAPGAELSDSHPVEDASKQEMEEVTRTSEIENTNSTENQTSVEADDSGVVDTDADSGDANKDDGLMEADRQSAQKQITDSPRERFDSQSSQAEVESGFSSPCSTPSPRNGPSVHRIVNSFLAMVPEEAKSSYQMDDSGYDTYLRDAHRQFSDASLGCQSWGWPKDPVSEDSHKQETFFEGAFLKLLLDKMSRMLDQTYDVNLQVTCVISGLSLLPHPNLHEYLLNPFLPLAPNARTLTTVIKKVVHDIETRVKKSENLQQQLIAVRRQLMGMTNNIRRSKNPSPQPGVDDSPMLEGVIVLEEFCKELAAIAFVKYHALVTQ